MDDEQRSVLIGPSIDDAGQAFEALFVEQERSVRGALVAQFGGDLGRDAACEAFRYGWEHRERITAMSNPAGYLFRVGQRWAKRQATRSRRRFGIAPPVEHESGFEPAMHRALTELTTRQRQAVILCFGYGLSHAEAGELIGTSRSSIQSHVERGMAKLRHTLGVPDDR